MSSKVCKVYWKSGAVELHYANPQGYLNVGTICFYIDDVGVHFEVGRLDKCIEEGNAGWERDKHNVIVTADLLDEVAYITLENEIMYPDAERQTLPGQRVQGVIATYDW